MSGNWCRRDAGAGFTLYYLPCIHWPLLLGPVPIPYSIFLPCFRQHILAISTLSVYSALIGVFLIPLHSSFYRDVPP